MLQSSGVKLPAEVDTTYYVANHDNELSMYILQAMTLAIYVYVASHDFSYL